jgi:hypothetical protein
MSSRAPSGCAAAWGSVASSAAATWARWARTETASDCSKIVRTRVETHGFPGPAELARVSILVDKAEDSRCPALGLEHVGTLRVERLK